METIRDIAIFGGTFDPPTLAHEAIIRHCLDDTRYDEVWLMPSGTRTDKPGMHGEQLRLDLLETVKQWVFDDDPRLQVTDFELKLPRPTETVHTSRALTATYPDTRFWFVYGADSIDQMHTWEDGAYLRERLALVAVPRIGFDLPAQSDRLRHITDDPIYAENVSSTAVRERIAAHRQYRHMVSCAVAEAIDRDKLYQDVVY